MNYKLYNLITDIINVILIYLVSFCLLGILILFVTEDQTLVFWSLVLFPAPILSYFIGKHTNHIWSLVLLHLGLFGLYLFSTDNILLGVLFGFYLTFLLVMEFRKKISEELPQKTNTSLMLLPLFVLLYFFSNYLGLDDLKLGTFILVIVFMLFYFINMYLLNFSKYFKQNEHITNIPITQIKLSNHVLILSYSSLSILIMILCSKLPFGNILSSIGNTFISFLRFILSFLFRGNKEEPILPQDITPINDTINPLPIENESSPIIDFILNLLFYILAIVVFIGLVALIVYGIYKLYKLFYSDKLTNKDDKTEFLSPFDKEEKLYKKTKKSTLQKFVEIFGRSNNDKIRKLYVKSVVKNADSEQLKKGYAPSILSAYAFDPGSTLLKNTVDTNKIKTLTEHYEKARYSNIECSKDELQTVKVLLK